jgi:hypothetical protein
MNHDISQLIGIYQMAAKTSKVKKQTTASVKAGTCLLCKNHAVRRGLCWKHYFDFIRERDRKSTAQERARFETKFIRAGKVLASGEVRKIKSKNPFSETA